MAQHTAIGAAKSSADQEGWTIDLPCPRCGAPVEIDESDHLLTCPYCRVSLILAQETPPRYVLAPAESGGGEILFIPYYRIRGSLFSCRRDVAGCEVSARVVDRTVLALDAPGLPHSLGIRPQAMRLNPVDVATSGRFCRASMPWSRALAGNGRAAAGSLRIGGEDSGSFPDAFVGETVSIIYLPVRIGDAVYDAVLRERLGSGADARRIEAAQVELRSRASMRFLATLCPECGREMDGDAKSLALSCANCCCLWMIEGTRLARAPLEAARSDWGGTDMLPFWRIKPRLSGIPLRSCADLVRFANIPRRILPGWESLDLHLWFPAFKIQPSAFLRLARSITLSRNPGIADGPSFSSGEGEAPALAGPHPTESSVNPAAKPTECAGRLYHPVTLPGAEAAEAIKILLAEVGSGREALFSRIHHASVDSNENELVFLPFRREGGELVNPEIPLAVSLGLLSLGRGL